MKSIKYSLLIFLSIGMIYSSNVKAQSALNLKAYGVWSRGDIKFDPDDPNYDYLLGMSAEDTKWSALQPTDSLSYDWSAIQNSIDVAAERNSKIYIGIGPGPESPLWIYENGVPKVYTIESGETTHDKWPFYPFYLDPDYKRFFLNFIEELGNFIFNQPPEKFKTIAFLQVKTGCTGDEVAYKGDVIDPQYELPKSGTLWSDFRLMVFEKYREVFLTGEKKVPLLFNAIDPEAYPTEWNWLITKIGDGFGVKQGALVRGHHLSNERIVVESWNPYLVNPKGLALFSRSEMDQTWKKPLYQINVELGFYWGILNGLNQGLSVNDVSNSALDFAKDNPSIQDSYRFFNKYADQIYPESSTKAFIALHEGLDASDIIKFPENIYGEANNSNQSRYEAICKDPVYANRGARMDDLYSATKGQVYQRSYQTGYNDAGWEIWPGNYSRFITQIDTENTSIGLFRIGGSITPDSPIYNRFARSFENSSGKNAMYFQLHEDLFDNSPGTVTFIVTYLDKTNGSSWSLKYDAGDSEPKEAYTITCNGSGTWKTQTVTVTDAVLNRNGPRESDFALINSDGKDDIFHMIQVEKGVASPIYKKSDNALLQSISWPDIPDSLKSAEWNDMIIPGFKPEVFSYTIPLPYGFKQIPALTAKSQDNNAIFQTERATNLKGALDERTTSFTVTAENGMTKLTYKVIFEPENAISLNSQPFNAEPLFTRLVYREWFNNNYIEISNPGTDTIDLSNYLIAIGENKTPDQIIAETLTFDTRYKYYIPGCDYPISDSSSFISDIVEADPDVEARIEPNGSFVIGMIEREDLSDNIHIDDCDIIFNKDLYFETDVKLVIPGPNTIINDGWMTSSALCLYKILNDSVKNGSKAISDPDDFRLIDVFGTYDGSYWAPDGEVLLDEDNKWNLTRKPEFWLGDTLPGVEGSWGVNKIESEWICHSKDDYSALGLSGSESHLKLTENIGIHNFDPVTDYISTISSVIYEVSLGYQSPQFINGISLNTTYSEFQANIIKAHEDQELVLKGMDGNIKSFTDIINDGDTLRVTSAYGNNITKYGLNTSSETQSDDAVLIAMEGSGYTVDYADSTGTVTGISLGISISSILENIIIPEKGTLNVIDAENNLVPLLTLNSSGSYSPTTAGESIFFEVIAENNYTKISYQLKYLVNENEAYAWSDVFPVDQVLSIVSDIPGNINVNSLFANLRASTGASIKLIDRAGLERLQGSVDFEDQVVVTSVNGSINRVYKLNFEGEILGSDAYLTSDVYVVDQENFTIDSIIMDTSIDEFLDNVTAVPYAKITILNEDQSPATSGNLSNGFAVVVVSGDGLKEVTYTFNFYDPTLGINPEIESIKLYPNPLSDHLTIEGIAPQSTISIKNIYGNTLRTITNENSTSLELSTGDLLPGIYLIQIQSHNHYTFTHKIVKK